MGLEEIAVCDVYRTTRNVAVYTIMVGRVLKGSIADGVLETLVNKICYLSPRALERLVVFLERGMKPPSERKRTAKEMVKA